MVRDHLLANDSVPTLSNALSRVLRVATGSSDSSTSFGTTTESTAMGVHGRGRSSSRGHGGRGRASNTSTNSRYCTHCGRTNHVVDKCWIKHGKPEWANTVTSGGEPAALEPSPNPSETVTLSREEYEQLLHRPVANSATPSTSSSPGAFVASHVTFFPSYYVFQDLQTWRTIGGGHERGGLYFLNTSPPNDGRALSASVSPLQWHCRLGHPSLPTLQKVLPIKSSRLAYTPLFGVTPRVFGCVCFVHLHSPTLDKLSPRSVKCIFLGYSWAQKGYRYYDPLRRRSFTSADVTFFKSTPCYSPNSFPTIPLTSVPLPLPTLTTPPHTETPPRPLNVYSRRNRSTNTTLTAPPGLPPTAAPGNLHATPANDLPIALRKGKRSRTAHPLAHSLSFQYLSPNYRAFSVFTLKFHADGTLERYKARLVAKGFTQTYGVYYFETFSPVARLNSIRVLFFLAVNLNWSMYQMDIKNAFLYGDLNETVYMEQPTGYVAQGEKQRMVCKLKKAIYGLEQSPRAWFDKFSRIIGEFGFSRCQADHSVFVQTTTSGMVVLAVYVDDILITGSDIVGIEEAKTYLQKHFVTKDLGRPRYFLGIKIAHSKHGISLSLRKYACDLLQEAGLLGTKPVDTPMDSNPDFWNDEVARSSAEAEYRAMAHPTSEILWLKNLLKELGFMYDDPVPMHCDNQATIHIASNPIFHERTKHIEIDCHFVREAVMSQKIYTPFTPFSEQRADIFTKALGGKQFDFCVTSWA
ncbi:Retrovirus-related Pol polyprotein from transposon RE2 [Sesamum angolense]|uniref:Retrovirus-related Pol polyprotein from transposon RE2 n=1 Tax=Sesamum angolense TaxID=2727404 RepID=A0AAE1T2W6_9LAMI|nr:Retrovirus-related Pol polyprotein from transposon RE2 [Sesamum angolense]